MEIVEAGQVKITESVMNDTNNRLTKCGAVLAVLQLLNGLSTIATIIAFGIFYPQDKILDLKIYFSGLLFIGTGVIGIVVYRRIGEAKSLSYVYLTLNVVYLLEVTFEFAMYTWWQINRRHFYGKYTEYQHIHDAFTIEFGFGTICTFFATVLIYMRSTTCCKRSLPVDQNYDNFENVVSSEGH